MAWQTITYRLTSDCPMLMHNGQTADPLNHWSKSMKQVSGKRKKTDADYEELAKIEFFAALYIDKTGPIIPSANIDSMLVNAAKKLRELLLAYGKNEAERRVDHELTQQAAEALEAQSE